MGTSATCTGAILGGSTRPLSSEWLMISPPMSRVLTPQLVCQTYSSSLFLFWNLTSKALPKFCPRSWLVPACSAYPFCIIASMQ